MATIKIQGQVHKVTKTASGKIVVSHPSDPKKTYDLTKLRGAKTIEAGVDSVQAYHKKNPVKKGK